MTVAFNSLENVSDDTLMVLYANGDISAARVLVLRHSSRILSLANRMLNNRTEADDITQEAMLRLWKIAPKWRQGEAKVSTWLYRITSNLCLDRLRHKENTTLDTIPEQIDKAPSQDETLTQKYRVQELYYALNQLPERQRLAVTLRYIEELSNPEIADIMNTTIEAIESLNARGKKTLTKIFKNRKDELGYKT